MHFGIFDEMRRALLIQLRLKDKTKLKHEPQTCSLSGTPLLNQVFECIFSNFGRAESSRSLERGLQKGEGRAVNVIFQFACAVKTSVVSRYGELRL